jgi:hypothetical protein
MFGKAKTLEAAVEYVAPHWTVLIRNIGQKDFTFVRSTTKFISEQDEFGTEINRRPAIQSFKSKGEADAWIMEHLPKVEKVDGVNDSTRQRIKRAMGKQLSDYHPSQAVSSQ